MQSIGIPATEFQVLLAARAEGIPAHAVEISGPLIEVGEKNLAEWGITEAAVDGIIERGVGLPIRVCNDADPHACDLKNDNYAQVGYTTKLWREDNWIHAAAAITKPDAAEAIQNGTWTPFGNGLWSATGAVEQITVGFEDTGMIDNLKPMSIAVFTPPATPAYVGSKYELVAAVVTAAEWTTAYINDLPDSAFAYVESCYGDTSDDKNLRHLPYKNTTGKVDLSHLRNALARVGQIKMTCDADKEKQDTIISTTQKKLRKLLDEATKTAATPEPKVNDVTEIDIETPGTQVPIEVPPVVAPPEVTPPPEIPISEPTEPEAYTQEDLDDAVKIALEKQKAEHDATLGEQKTGFEEQMSKMTSNDDMQAMFASFKTELDDERVRTGLVDDYMEIVSASAVLSAPFRVEGEIDDAKMTGKRTEMMALKTASVEQALEDVHVMVAAMPTGQTAFDAAIVAANKPDTGRPTGFTVGDCKGGD